jgi:hypothetical protein
MIARRMGENFACGLGAGPQLYAERSNLIIF